MEYPWPSELHPNQNLPVIQCATKWHEFIAKGSDLYMVVQAAAQVTSAEANLRFLGMLTEETPVYANVEVPFEFRGLFDTANKALATAVVKLAIGAEHFNLARGSGDDREALLRKSKEFLDQGIAELPPIEKALVPPIVRDGGVHVVNTLLLLIDIHRGPQPPVTLDMQQYVDRRAQMVDLYKEVSKVKVNPRWRETVLMWCKRQTMRTIAHHLAAALALELAKLQNPNHRGPICSVETIAKRQCEALTLLRESGFTADSIYLSTQKEFDAGYKLSLPSSYKPILVEQIKDGRFFH